MFSLKILSISFFVSLPPCATTFPSMATAGREIAPYFNISIMFSSFTSSAFIFFLVKRAFDCRVQCPVFRASTAQYCYLHIKLSPEFFAANSTILILYIVRRTTNIVNKNFYLHLPLHLLRTVRSLSNSSAALRKFSAFMQYLTLGGIISP